MKIIVFGASGWVGSHIAREAARRGHSVSAAARSLKRLDALEGVDSRIALDLATSSNVHALVGAHDVVIGALRPPAGREPEIVELTRAVLDAAVSSRRPAFIVGGAATLKLGDGSGHTVLSAPGFLPESVRPIAEACAAQDALLEEYPNARWTCLRPPAELHAGPAMGAYRFGGDALVADETGAAQISVAYFAAAMLDLVETDGEETNRRMTVGGARARKR